MGAAVGCCGGSSDRVLRWEQRQFGGASGGIWCVSGERRGWWARQQRCWVGRSVGCAGLSWRNGVCHQGLNGGCCRALEYRSGCRSGGCSRSSGTRRGWRRNGYRSGCASERRSQDCSGSGGRRRSVCMSGGRRGHCSRSGGGRDSSGSGRDSTRSVRGNRSRRG